MASVPARHTTSRTALGDCLADRALCRAQSKLARSAREPIVTYDCGVYVRTEYLSPTRAILVYEMPLAEVIYDLYDKLKSVTHGYGTMDYDFLAYRPADLVRLDVLVHHTQ